MRPLLRALSRPAVLLSCLLTACGGPGPSLEETQDGEEIVGEHGRALASRCAGGVTVLADGQATPIEISAHPSGIYWANFGASGLPSGGSVVRLRPDGVQQVLADGLPGPTGLAVSPRFAFYRTGAALSGNSLVRVPAGGGPPTVLGGTLGYGARLALRGGRLYWTSTSGEVSTAPTGGGAITVLFRGPGAPWGIAIEGAGAFWKDRGGGVYGLSLEGGGGAPRRLATAGAYGLGVAARAGWVYYADLDYRGRGSIMRVRQAGGGAMALAPAHGVEAVATDGAIVYWSNFLDGTLRKAPAGGGAATVVAAGLRHPAGVALLDGDPCVYFTDASAGQVLSAPR